MDNQGKLLNPLHDIQFVSNWVQATGRYFPQERRTGRTTVLALQYIAQAMQQPHEPVYVKDHYVSENANRCLIHTMQDMVDKLGLDFFVFSGARNTVTFTR